MFTYQRSIRLQDTDATGVLYFANQLAIAVEAFEAFLAHKGLPLADILESGDFLLPVVHAEADFSAPVYVGDALIIELKTGSIGTSSFRIDSIFFKKEVQVGTTSIIHVTVSRANKQSVSIPELIYNKIYFK